MDVSAFEGDAGDDLTWEDLVPDGMRGPIKHGARIFAPFGGLLVFMITFAGCAVAFVVMLSCIVNYWVLARLLLATASLLRIVYEEPPALDSEAKPNDSVDDKPDPNSDGSTADKPLITAEDLDQFELYLRSTDTPNRQNDAVSTEKLREAALERILQQEQELDAQIQAHSPASDIDQPAEGYYQPIATRSPLAMQEKTDKEKAAKQDDWPAQFVPHKVSKSSSSPSSNAPETRPNDSGYSVEQLAEAANFARTATRGHLSGHSSVKDLRTSNPQRTTRPGNAMINAKSDVRALDPRRPAQLNFKFAHSPESLPPHLKKLNAAKAARISNSAQSSTPGNSDLGDNGNLEGRNLEGRNLEVSDALAAAKSNGTKSGDTELDNHATRISSESTVVEEIRRHVSGSEPRRATPEGTPLATTRIQGGVSIDALKALNPKSAGRQRRERLPGSFIAGVERNVRIMIGKEEGLQRRLRKPYEPENEHADESIFWRGSINKDDANPIPPLHQEDQNYGQQDKLGHGGRSNIEQPPSQDQTLGQDFNHQTERTDDALSGATTRLSEALSQHGELRDDRDEDDQKTDQIDLGESQSCDLSLLDTPSEVAGTTKCSGETISQELPERRALFKEMAEGFNKSVEQSQMSTTATEKDNKRFNTGSTTDHATTLSGGHELDLDLVGLDFSAGMRSPPDPVSTTKPQLKPSSQEFVPGIKFLRDVEEQRLQSEKQERLDARLAQSQAARRLRKEQEAEAAAAAMIARKQPEQTFLVPEHLYWPEPFSGSAFPMSSSANMMPMHHRSATFPAPSLFTPFGSSEYVFQATPQQPPPQMSFAAASHKNLTLGRSPFHLSTSESPQYLSSTSPVKAHAKRASITNKAVAIKKPLEVKYNENFPQLPAGKSSPPDAKVQPPPGLSSSRGSPQNTFDALLSDTVVGKGPVVATSNPFDALLQKGNNTELHPKAIPNEDSHNELGQAAGVETDPASKVTHKKRKQARTDCARAWVERESIRKRVVGTYTLDGMRALEYASKTYNDLRSHLASLMASGELREEDAKMFECFSTSDLRVPAASAGSIRKLIHNDKMVLSPATIGKPGAIQGMKQENKAPKRSDEEINELYKKAINARNVYAESHAFFTRPPPQGRASVKDLRAQGEARVERAARYYAQSREALAAAYGGALPAETKEKLWTYDDDAMKKSRSSWMP